MGLLRGDWSRLVFRTEVAVVAFGEFAGFQIATDMALGATYCRGCFRDLPDRMSVCSIQVFGELSVIAMLAASLSEWTFTKGRGWLHSFLLPSQQCFHVVP